MMADEKISERVLGDRPARKIIQLVIAIWIISRVLKGTPRNEPSRHRGPQD